MLLYIGMNLATSVFMFLSYFRRRFHRLLVSLLEGLAYAKTVQMTPNT